MGKDTVQKILADHGIDRVLAEEGGRTSRGSIRLMQTYAAFLNELGTSADLKEIEAFWVGRVKTHFSAKPFVLRFDASKSLRAILQNLIEQAEQRQRTGSGTKYVGTVMQHLVGAKLDLILGGITHHGASTADEGTGRSADFLMGDVAIHVTTSPTEALLRKCVRNLEASLRPLILTTERGTILAQSYAEQAGVVDRVDVLEVQQFIAGNVFEHGKFELEGRRDWAAKLLEKYNEVVSNCETDPSLRIDLGK